MLRLTTLLEDDRVSALLTAAKHAYVALQTNATRETKQRVTENLELAFTLFDEDGGLHEFRSPETVRQIEITSEPPPSGVDHACDA
jgi:hypothetical protein